MNNVISFADRSPSREPLERADKEKKQASDRVRAEHMHRKMLDNPMINRASDRFQIARNLALIFDEMEKQGCRRAALLQKSGKAQKIDSTKVLYNYTLPPDLEFEGATDRVRKLTKKASKYLDLAKAAATEMKVDREQIILQLFQNTTYEVLGEISDEQISYLQEISKLLIAIGKAAIKRHDLSSYHAMLRSNEIGWDIDGSFGHFQCLPCSTWIEDRSPRHVSYLGYVPTVLLYRQQVGPQPYDAIAGRAFQIDFETNPQALKDYFERNVPLPEKHSVMVRTEVHSEIWLGVAPLHPSYKWEPVFEKRYRFEINDDPYSSKQSIRMRSYDPDILFQARNGGFEQLDFAHRLIWLRYFSRFPAVGDGGNFRAFISPHFDDEESWSLSASDLTRESLEGRWLIALDKFDSNALNLDQDISVPEGQFFYERIGLDSCAKYLRPLYDENDWRDFEDLCRAVDLNPRLWPELEQHEAWFSRYPNEAWPLAHTVAPVGSIALAIEQNLLGPSESRLDTVLFETIEERIARARAYYQSVTDRRDRELTRLLASWEE
jgi:hypothetical protein